MPKIINLEDNSTITEDSTICSSVFSKARGLMFSKKRNLIFWFRRPSFVPLHMFFVFFPIDVFFLDKNKTVLEIKRNFRPFSYYRPKNKASFIVELSTDDSRKNGVKVGDKLDFLK